MPAGWKGPLSVYVVDENGKPCPGTQLQFQLRTSMGYGLATTEPVAETDANGDYQLDPANTKPTKGEPADFFKAASIEGVLAYKPGHAISLADPFTRANPRITVRLTRSHAARIHAVYPNGRLAPGILFSAELFGRRYEAEISIPPSWRTDFYRVTTDQNGSAIFHDVPEGYSVIYAVEDERFLPTNRQQDNPVVSGLTEYPTLHLVASASIEGNLRVNGKPIAGVHIQMNTGGPMSARLATSDANGHYRITRVPDGTCDVHYIEAPSAGAEILAGWVARQHDGLRITAGQNLKGVDFTFEKGGVVKGRITDENGMPQNLSVSAIAPNFVQFRDGIASNPSDYYTAGGQGDGTYRLRLPAGRYKLQLGILPNPPERWVNINAGGVIQADFRVDIKSRTRTTGSSMCSEDDD